MNKEEKQLARAKKIRRQEQKARRDHERFMREQHPPTFGSCWETPLPIDNLRYEGKTP